MPGTSGSDGASAAGGGTTMLFRRHADLSTFSTRCCRSGQVLSISTATLSATFSDEKSGMLLPLLPVPRCLHAILYILIIL